MKLKEDDKITFIHPRWERRGRVCSNFVVMEDESNYFVFKKLGLNKVDFCKKAYGYELSGGDWPWFKPNDYQALYRCLVALDKELKEQGGYVKINGKRIKRSKKKKMKNIAGEKIKKYLREAIQINYDLFGTGDSYDLYKARSIEIAKMLQIEERE